MKSPSATVEVNQMSSSTPAFMTQLGRTNKLTRVNTWGKEKLCYSHDLKPLFLVVFAGGTPQ